jgi:hypothetical protein
MEGDVRGVVLLACVVAAGGCQTRVVRYNPMLGGLPGAESGMPIVRGWNHKDPTLVPESQLVQETPEGKTRLVAKTGRHLILHIYNTIEDGQRDLFVSEVLSAVTKAECAERGVDPGTLYDDLARDRLDLYELFNLMPMGEQTPGALMTPLGSGAYRVQVTGLGTSRLRWTGFDMVMERGNWRLRWLVER